jgi:hypothetical protein
MEIITGRKLLDYFMQYVVPTDQQCFYTVHKPLPVFKKALHDDRIGGRVIVNLLIPVGAIVYAGVDAFDASSRQKHRKMRASAADVHSVANINGTPSKRAVSWYDPGFYYHAGDRLSPRNAFSQMDATCAPGIHFFLNLGDALEYHI